jgi:Right handed beta helix region
MAITLTCAALLAALANAATSGTLIMKTDCLSPDKANPALSVPVYFTNPVVLDLAGHRITGFSVKGGNITIRGGTLEAPNGSGIQGGRGVAHYGMAIHAGARNVTVENMAFTNVRKAIVLWRAENVTVRNNRFFGELEDGLIARQSSNVEFSHNDVRDLVLRQPRCTLPDGTVETGMPAARSCKDKSGVLVGGWHADGIQAYDGMNNVRIEHNRIVSQGQGVVDFGNRTSLPSENFVVRHNFLSTAANPLSLVKVQSGFVQYNTLEEYPDGFKTVVRVRGPKVVNCGNKVPRYNETVMRTNRGWEPCPAGTGAPR